MSTKPMFIARVLITAFIDGARIQVAAGEPLPEGIHAHDLAELKRLRAIEDLSETAEATAAAEMAEVVASRRFKAARKAVKAAAEAIKPPATPENE